MRNRVLCTIAQSRFAQINHKRIRQIAFMALTGAAFAAAAGPASARNLDLLTRLLIPAFVAQDFAGLCRVNDPAFTIKPAGGAASLDDFAEHLKIEITSGLTQTEAIEIMRVAAGTARSAAQDELRKLAGGKSATDANASIRAWCAEDAKSYIESVENSHYAKHVEFDRIITEAKQP